MSGRRGDPVPVTIRALASSADFEQCLALQERTWGPDFTEAVPPSILRITERTGGTAGGAFDPEGRLVGFVFGLAGIEDGEPIHWSDMLAVRPERRGSGLGRRLKCWQRDRCLERGVTRMYWSYDPLESRNAWLNLGRLGAVAREYVPDMYGAGDSPLHSGIGTDRLIVTWELDSRRVQARLARQPTARDRQPPARDRESAPPAWEDVWDLPLAFPVDVEGPVPRPAVASGGPGDALAGGHPSGASTPPGATGRREADALLVPIPVDIQSLKADDPAAALAWREATRGSLVPRLARGWEVREFVRAPGPVSYYLLTLLTRRLER